MMLLSANGGVQAGEAVVPQDGPCLAAGVSQPRPGRSKCEAGDGTTEIVMESGAFMMLLAQMIPGGNGAGDVDSGRSVGVTEGVGQGASGGAPLAGGFLAGAAAPAANGPAGLAGSTESAGSTGQVGSTGLPGQAGRAEVPGAGAAGEQDIAGGVSAENTVAGCETAQVVVQAAAGETALTPREGGPAGRRIEARFAVGGEDVPEGDKQAPEAGLTDESGYPEYAAVVVEAAVISGPTDPAVERHTAPVSSADTGGHGGRPEGTPVRTGGPAPGRVQGGARQSGDAHEEPQTAALRPKKAGAKATAMDGTEAGSGRGFGAELESAGIHGQSSPSAAAATRGPQAGEAGVNGHLETREVMRQIVDQARVLRLPGRTEVEIRLEPESLGRVQLKVSVENGRLTARFTVSSPEVKGVIESRMDELRHDLASHGLDIRELNVSVGGDGRTFDGRERQEGWFGQSAGGSRLGPEGGDSAWRAVSPQILARKRGSIDLIA